MNTSNTSWKTNLASWLFLVGTCFLAAGLGAGQFHAFDGTMVGPVLGLIGLGLVGGAGKGGLGAARDDDKTSEMVGAGNVPPAPVVVVPAPKAPTLPPLPCLVISVLVLSGCAAMLAPLHALEVAACEWVPAPYGTVCREAIPIVDAVVASVPAASRRRPDQLTCARAQITGDGKTVVGAVCVEVCGDLSRAMPTDPCPAVDAALRKAAAK